MAPPPLYARLLGPGWGALHAAVRACHAPGVRTGRVTVRRGALGAIARLPASGEDLPMELSVEEAGGVARWTRRFGADVLASEQFDEDGLLVERTGALELRFRLSVDGGALRFEQVGARFGGVPLPRALGPRVEAHARGDGDGMAAAVLIRGPLGPLVAYDVRIP